MKTIIYRVRQHGACFYPQFAEVIHDEGKSPESARIIGRDHDWKYFGRGAPVDSLEEAKAIIKSNIPLPVVIHEYP